MRTHLNGTLWWAALGVAVVAAGLIAAGCGMSNPKVPELTGPAELAISLKLTVNPDVLYADGTSTALVRAELRGVDGGALSGIDVYFALATHDGAWADLGTLSNNRVITNASGIAEVTYTAPPRTDAMANQTLLIAARPVLNDAQAAIYRSVRLELRSPDPKLYPQNSDNKDPKCQFTVEAPDGLEIGADIHFLDNSFDEDGWITRYMWNWGDGSDLEYTPDGVHAFRKAGNFTVSHKIWDDDGASNTCTPVTLPIN